MADFFFVLKTFLFTLALVVLMQIKVGNTTIEERCISGSKNLLFIELWEKWLLVP